MNNTAAQSTARAELAAFSAALLHLSVQAYRSQTLALWVVRQDADTAAYDLVGEQPRHEFSRVPYVRDLADAGSGRYVICVS